MNIYIYLFLRGIYSGICNMILVIFFVKIAGKSRCSGVLIGIIISIMVVPVFL